MPNVLTYISLPRGRGFSDATNETILRLVITELGWVRPNRYGKHDAEHVLPKGSTDDHVRFLADFMAKNGTVGIQESRSIRFNLAPPQPNLPFGDIVWEAPSSHPALRLEKHRDAVWQLMRLVDAPLAEAMTPEQKQDATYRFVETPEGEEQLLTVRGHWEGLRDVFWRMWFGRRYVEFFGAARLSQAPVQFSSPLEPDGFFLQAFEKPDSWKVPEGQQAVAAVKNTLSRNTFYDRARPDAPLDAPGFDDELR